MFFLNEGSFNELRQTLKSHKNRKEEEEEDR